VQEGSRALRVYKQHEVSHQASTSHIFLQPTTTHMTPQHIKQTFLTGTTTHTHIHLHTRMHKHAQTRTHKHARTHTHVHLIYRTDLAVVYWWVPVCVCVRVHVSGHARVRVCMCARERMCLRHCAACTHVHLMRARAAFSVSASCLCCARV